MGTKLAALSVLLALLVGVRGHGRLMDPPSRASMWRVGFNTPKNYNDNQLFCGGFHNQWDVNRGRCGVCGDPWQGPREHEAGGKYATGQIARQYSPGQTITIAVEITANHLGFFEFKLCPNNDVKKTVTQDCLDKHALELVDSPGTRHFIGSDTGYYYIRVKLPNDVTCSQCLLQWRYHTGNSYGVGNDGKNCKGCGPQEEFYGCADVAIGYGQPMKTQKPSVQQPITTKKPSMWQPLPTKKVPWFQPITTRKPFLFQPITTKKPFLFQPITTKKPFLFQPITTKKPQWFQPITTKKPLWYQPITTRKPFWYQPITTRKPFWYQPITTKNPFWVPPFITKRPLGQQPMGSHGPQKLPVAFQPLHTSGSGSRGTCRGINNWAGDEKLDFWCTVNCAKAFCPPTMCRCT